MIISIRRGNPHSKQTKVWDGWGACRGCLQNGNKGRFVDSALEHHSSDVTSCPDEITICGETNFSYCMLKHSYILYMQGSWHTNVVPYLRETKQSLHACTVVSYSSSLPILLNLPSSSNFSCTSPPPPLYLLVSIIIRCKSTVGWI